ncbi:MAG: hypothetical protein M3P11_10795 [Actinomycetota bacterium]|nr:hypothetical protein [Actinomycetota bacterium]
MIDPFLDKLDTIAHEAAHVVAMLRFGMVFKEVDVDSPDAEFAGWVIPERRDYTGWEPFQLEAECRRQAVVRRIGTLAAGQSWDGVEALADRPAHDKLGEAIPLLLPIWDDIVLSDAKELLAEEVNSGRYLAVVDVLTEHRRLTGEQLNALLLEKGM